MKKCSWIEIVSWITAILTLIATCYIWYTSNKISKDIAQMDKTRTSAEYTAKFYDNIMNNQEFYDIWRAIDEWRQIPSGAKKASFIDVFEWLWDDYCNWLVYLRNIKTYKHMFEKTCQNEQIISLFKWERNAFSLLCFDLWYIEWMWEAYNGNWSCNILK